MPQTLEIQFKNDKTKSELVVPHTIVYPRALYYIYVLFGIVMLMAWNVFYSVRSYWVEKFAGSGAHFYAQIPLISMCPNTLMLVLSGMYGHHVRTSLRHLLPLALMSVVFLVICSLVFVDSGGSETPLQALNILLIVLVNGASATFQSGVMSLAARMSSDYIMAVVTGQALGAVFCNLCLIVSITFTEVISDGSILTSTFVFFTIAVTLIVSSLLCFLWMRKQDFYIQLEQAELDSRHANNRHGTKRETTISSWQVLGYIKWHALSVFLVFTITLSVYPTITSYIQPTVIQNEIWNRHYFVLVTCFLLFNIMDLIGRKAYEFLQWPKSHQINLTLLLSVMRIVFIPLLLLCNLTKLNFPTLFTNEFVYAMIVGTFAFSSGYVSSVNLALGSRDVPETLRNQAGALMVAFLSMGLATGSCLSSIISSLLVINE